MVCQPVRLALLIGAITAAAVSPVRANHTSAPGCTSCAPGGSGGSVASGSTGTCYRTITCTECVPETYQVKRVCYRTECRTETYQTCRTECYPVCKTRTCTVYDRVPCMKTVCKKVCTMVPCCEDRCVTKYNTSYVNETCMQKKCVSRGHWECQCVPACGGFGGLFGGHGHGNNCCDPCGQSCCVPTRMKKVWVSCPQYIECPVTVCRKVCTPYTVTCKVNTCKAVWSDVTCQVCSYTCVPRQVCQNYTCYETRSIPCTQTRTVRVCVPYETCVTCTRMVTRQVCRQVPVCNDPCCNNGCNNDPCCNNNNGCCNSTSCCQTSCCQTSCCGGKHNRLSGLFGGCHNRNSCCCR